MFNTDDSRIFVAKLFTSTTLEVNKQVLHFLYLTQNIVQHYEFHISIAASVIVFNISIGGLHIIITTTNHISANHSIRNRLQMSM